MKKYIVKATADIQLTVATSTPECMKQLLESALKDVCDISADVTNMSIKEYSPLPGKYKKSLEQAFIRRSYL